ncbi:MAG: hypothetical protein C0524_17140 [Rhodobacter sp.]|nr:hypothetical protein [Rhodobacter sp.]
MPREQGSNDKLPQAQPALTRFAISSPMGFVNGINLARQTAPSDCNWVGRSEVDSSARFDRLLTQTPPSRSRMVHCSAIALADLYPCDWCMPRGSRAGRMRTKA